MVGGRRIIPPIMHVHGTFYAWPSFDIASSPTSRNLLSAQLREMARMIIRSDDYPVRLDDV
jgi:hypothetical protein